MESKQPLETVYDVQQLLKKYNTFIYIGNQTADCLLMQSEIKDLYDSGMLEQKDYIRATAILRGRLQSLEK